MIKQKIILKYIIAMLSVLGVGIFIFKQGDGVKQNELTKEVKKQLADEELAKINDIKKNKKPTTANNIQINTVDPKIKIDLKTSKINLNNNGDLNGDNNNIKKELKTTTPIKHNIKPNTDSVASNADSIKVEDIILIQQTANTTPTLLKNDNSNGEAPPQITKEIVEKKSLSNGGDINTLSDNKFQEEQLGDYNMENNESINERLKKELKGYYYRFNENQFVLENLNSILYILKLAVASFKQPPHSPFNIQNLLVVNLLNATWKNNEDKIVNTIKHYHGDASGLIPLILQDVSNPELIYHLLGEFLFIYMQRTVEDILTDAFTRHISVIEPFMGNDRIKAYHNSKQLKDLYYKNLQGHIFMFVRAINLINNYNNEIIANTQDIIDIRQSKASTIDISDTTIYLITIIRIILDMKLKQTNINILVLKLTEKLQVNLIKLIKKFTDLFDICDINHNKIEPTQLINLIQKIYNNTATPQEIGDLNQMLF